MGQPRVAIIGAGTMGTGLAALIGTRAPTVMVCRNCERASELFAHGAVSTGLIESASRPVIVSRTEDLALVGPISLVFIATKTSAIPSVARDLRPLLDERRDDPDAPFVISYQNGIEPGEELIRLLDYKRVLRVVLNYGAVLRHDPPRVDVLLNFPPHFIGNTDPRYESDCRAVAQLLTESGLETQYEPDIEKQVWIKSILNAAMNPVAALVNATVGQVLDSPARGTVDRLLREAIAVSRAEGLDLPEAFVDRAYEIYALAAPHVPSMVEDIRRGRESEVGQLNRQIIRHARSLGVPVPTHEVVDQLIETFDWKVYHARERENGGAPPASNGAERLGEVGKAKASHP